MASLISNKSFVYSGTAQEVKEWLNNQGFSTEDITTSNGQLVSFKVIGTSLKVGYDIPLTPFDTGKSSMHLLNGPQLVVTEPEIAQRGLDLYQKLYSI